MTGTGPGARMVATGNTLTQPVPRAAATTRLLDQDGHPLSLRSMRGKVVVLAPLLTMCQETCPMTTANMHRAAAAELARGLSGRVLFLELTVDPQRDTVRRMHAYAKLYGTLPDWRLATGNPAQVTTLWKALGVSTKKTKPDDTARDWMTGRLIHHSYDVHHQDVVMVLDPAGRVRWITVGHPDAHGTRLPTTLKKFLNDEGRRNYARPDAEGASSWTAHDVEQAVAYVRSLSSGS
jgi:protein SCO1/2